MDVELGVEWSLKRTAKANTPSFDDYDDDSGSNNNDINIDNNDENDEFEDELPPVTSSTNNAAQSLPQHSQYSTPAAMSNNEKMLNFLTGCIGDVVKKEKVQQQL